MGLWSLESWFESKPASHAERCPSGLRSTLGKRVLGKLNRGFESHPLRHIHNGRDHRSAWVSSHEFSILVLASFRPAPSYEPPSSCCQIAKDALEAIRQIKPGDMERGTLCY